MKDKDYLHSKKFSDYLMHYYKPQKKYLRTELFDKMIYAPHLKDGSLPKYSSYNKGKIMEQWLEKIAESSYEDELEKIAAMRNPYRDLGKLVAAIGVAGVGAGAVAGAPVGATVGAATGEKGKKLKRSLKGAAIGGAAGGAAFWPAVAVAAKIAEKMRRLKR